MASILVIPLVALIVSVAAVLSPEELALLESTADHPRGPRSPPAGNLELQARRLEHKLTNQHYSEHPEWQKVIPWSKHAASTPGVEARGDLHHDFANPRSIVVHEPLYDSLKRSSSMSVFDDRQRPSPQLSARTANPGHILPPAMKSVSAAGTHPMASPYGSLPSERAQNRMQPQIVIDRLGQPRVPTLPRVEMGTLQQMMAQHHIINNPLQGRPIGRESAVGVPFAVGEVPGTYTHLGKMGRPKVVGSMEGFYPLRWTNSSARPDPDSVDHGENLRREMGHEAVAARARRVEDTKLLLKEEKRQDAAAAERAQSSTQQHGSAGESARGSGSEKKSKKKRVKPYEAPQITTPAHPESSTLLSRTADGLRAKQRRQAATKAGSENTTEARDEKPPMNRSERRAQERAQKKAGRKERGKA